MCPTGAELLLFAGGCGTIDIFPIFVRMVTVTATVLSMEPDFTARWLSQDPLAEKYYAHSPYLFCAGNPVRFVDPEGEIWYSVNSSNGNISIIDDEKTGPDRLYVDADLIGPKLNTAFLFVSDPTILSSLAKDNIDSFGEKFHYAISSSKELGDVFLFLAKNTSVEWSLESYRTSSYTEHVLATSNSISSSSTGRNIPLSAFDENNLLMSLHSHPRIDGTMGASENVGYGPSDMLNIINYSNRRFNSHGQSLNGFPKHYVYHKHSQTLYQYTPYQSSIYIKRVLSGKDIQKLMK